MTTANFRQTDAPSLWARNGATFYRVTPNKGARIDGTFSVGITSRDQLDTQTGGRTKVDCPTLWVDMSPSAKDARGNIGSERLPVTVNGAQRSGWDCGATVEFLPATADDHRAQWYPRVTVGGRDYLVRATVDTYAAFTDKACETLAETLAAIAVEYVTDARWHDYRVARATAIVADRERDLATAQTALDDARAELAAIAER